MQFTDNSRLSIRSVLVDYLIWAEDVDIAVAFLRKSGASILLRYFQRIIRNGGRVRVLCGQDFGYTESDALDDLQKIGVDIKVFDGEQIFHPKCYIFRNGRNSRAIIGSSNLTSSGLENGVEWNLAIDDNEQKVLQDIVRSFEQLWTSPKVETWSNTLAQKLRQTQANTRDNDNQRRIVEKLDFVGESFRFPFTVNKSFLDRSNHPLTIIKRHYPVLDKYITSHHTEVGLFSNNRYIEGYIYKGYAGFGLYYQLAIRDDEFQKIARAFYMGQRIEVEIKIHNGDVKVFLET